MLHYSSTLIRILALIATNCILATNSNSSTLIAHQTSWPPRRRRLVLMTHCLRVFLFFGLASESDEPFHELKDATKATSQFGHRKTEKRAPFTHRNTFVFLAHLRLSCIDKPAPFMPFCHLLRRLLLIAISRFRAPCSPREDISASVRW
jgi:hypothetical protein